MAKAPPTLLSLSKRVEKLEQDNRRLTAAINNLNKRLEQAGIP